MQFTEKRASELVHRWERVQMHVRCGLSMEQPGCLRLYLHTGLKIARSGLRPAAAVHLAMLRTLLCTAQDEELPWFWRSVADHADPRCTKRRGSDAPGHRAALPVPRPTGHPR